MSKKIKYEDSRYFVRSIDDLKKLSKKILRHSKKITVRDDYYEEIKKKMVAIYSEVNLKLLSYKETEATRPISREVRKYCFGTIHKTIDLMRKNYVFPWDRTLD